MVFWQGKQPEKLTRAGQGRGPPTHSPNMNQPRIFTIGHSTHPLEDFVALLQKHEVTALADVRSAPFSRFNPQFNKAALQQELKSHGIQYVFLGRELGGRPKDQSLYKDGHVQYEQLARIQPFQDGIDRLTKGTASHNIALMCAEKDPQHCHRTLLIAPVLTDRGIMVEHILADGSLQPHTPAPRSASLFTPKSPE